MMHILFTNTTADRTNNRVDDNARLSFDVRVDNNLICAVDNQHFI